MKLAQTMGAELDTFAMKWDQHQNKDQFVEIQWQIFNTKMRQQGTV